MKYPPALLKLPTTHTNRVLDTKHISLIPYRPASEFMVQIKQRFYQLLRFVLVSQTHLGQCTDYPFVVFRSYRTERDSRESRDHDDALS